MSYFVEWIGILQNGDGKMNNDYDSLSSLKTTKTIKDVAELNGQIMKLFNIYRAKIEVLEEILVDHDLIDRDDLESRYELRTKEINESINVDKLVKDSINKIDKLN